MLAQNFKSAAELKIPETDHAALVKVLVLMETEQMRYVPWRELLPGHGHQDKYDGLFNMGASFAGHECGTSNCIRGAAIAIGGAKFRGATTDSGLNELFYRWIGDPNVEQGARALRNYLTYGQPKWKEVMSVEMNNG